MKLSQGQTTSSPSLHYLPEALGDVDVLCGLLDHQAPLPPQLQHGGQNGQALAVKVLEMMIMTSVT